MPRASISTMGDFARSEPPSPSTALSSCETTGAWIQRWASSMRSATTAKCSRNDTGRPGQAISSYMDNQRISSGRLLLTAVCSVSVMAV